MDKKTSEEELAEASAQQDPWSDSQGELPHIAAQNPLGPSTSRLRRQIATIRGDAVCLLKDARRVLADLGHLAGDQVEALRTSFDRACVTIPDGQRLLATEHAALIAFARANKIPEERLWEDITVRQHGRVTEGRFQGWSVTDITALPGSTKIENLQLHNNEIADISPLANCGALVSLTLSWNEITDISALASCGKLENVWLGFNRIKDISALASCKRLRYLDVGVNQITDISVLAHFRKLWGVSLAVNEITDISVLESCPRLKIVEVFDNPLSGEAAAVIEKLRGRGVKVYSSSSGASLQPLVISQRG